MGLLGNLFKKVDTAVYETSSDGSVVKKVFDPKGREVSEDVAAFHNSGGGLFSFLSSLFPIKPLSDGNGRNYNSATGNWEAPASGQSPSICTYKAAQDYQGSVPCNDGSGNNG